LYITSENGIKETGQNQEGDRVISLSILIPNETPYTSRQGTEGESYYSGTTPSKYSKKKEEKTPVSFSILIEKGKGGRCWKDTRC